MRVKRGVPSHSKHSKIRHSTKGMTHSNRASVKRGKQAVTKSLQFAYRDRKNNKRTFRQTWNSRINSAARLNGTTYSQLISTLKQSNIKLDRKILSELAVNEPEAFKKLTTLVGEK